MSSLDNIGMQRNKLGERNILAVASCQGKQVGPQSTEERGTTTLSCWMSFGRGIGPATASCSTAFDGLRERARALLWGLFFFFFCPRDKWVKQYCIIGCVCVCVCVWERENRTLAELIRLGHFAFHLTSQATAFSAWASQQGSSPLPQTETHSDLLGFFFFRMSVICTDPDSKGKGQNEIENLFLYYVISCRDCYIIRSQKSKGLDCEVILPTSWVTTHSFIVSSHQQKKPLSSP